MTYYNADNSGLTASVVMALSERKKEIKSINEYEKLLKGWYISSASINSHRGVLRNHFLIDAYHFKDCNRIIPGHIISILNKKFPGMPPGNEHWVHVKDVNHELESFIVNDPIGQLDYKTGDYLNCDGYNQVVKKEALYERWKGSVFYLWPGFMPHEDREIKLKHLKEKLGLFQPEEANS